ncbi:MAG: hypothetical protein M3552_15260 [Planctomycetota bacterium]|nr:hypothetical protein [Planctomycetaceae bacterium]MDQ3331989.1 hypothetical protein [Planctomycetota bacterium]
MAILRMFGEERDLFPLCLFAGFVLPFIGGLMLVRWSIGVRVVLAILFAVCGFIVSFCGGFVAWLMAGAPGFRMD